MMTYTATKISDKKYKINAKRPHQKNYGLNEYERIPVVGIEETDFVNITWNDGTHEEFISQISTKLKGFIE